MSPSLNVGESGVSNSATLVTSSATLVSSYESKSSDTNANLGNQSSWSEVVRKNTVTHPTMTSATKGTISASTTSTSLDVKKIMADAAERAANIILQDMRMTRAT